MVDMLTGKKIIMNDFVPFILKPNRSDSSSEKMKPLTAYLFWERVDVFPSWKNPRKICVGPAFIFEELQ